MIVPRNLDLDRLHQAVELVISDRYRHCQGGKTVAYTMMMIGEVGLLTESSLTLILSPNVVSTRMSSCPRCSRRSFHSWLSEEVM